MASFDITEPLQCPRDIETPLSCFIIEELPWLDPLIALDITMSLAFLGTLLLGLVLPAMIWQYFFGKKEEEEDDDDYEDDEDQSILWRFIRFNGV